MSKRIPDSDDSHFEDIPSLRLLLAFNNLFDRLSGCFVQKRTWKKAKTLAYGLLCSESPHTITSWLMAAGLADVDWTGSYDFFSHAHWKAGDVFENVLGSTARFFSGCSAFFAAMDEVHLPKSGKKIPGVCTLRDPLGLHWTNALHRAQRWLHVSALVPMSDDGIAGPVRGVPVDMRHAPVAKKPGKNATKEQTDLYKTESKEKSISVQGLQAIKDTRDLMHKKSQMKDMLLVMSVDGSFTNGTVFGDVPERTVLVGRVAKNIALFSPPPPYPGKGRKRKYGDRCQSPEELRQNDSIRWQKTSVYACGKRHDVEYKTMGPVMWKSVTKDKPLRLIVIRPLSYRPSKKSKLMYREPVYLLVSDPDYPVELALQCYFHRWEIEVNHRDMKSIIGVGDAQVRNEESVFRAPPFVTAVYSLALLASLDAYGPSRDDHYGPMAKWRNDYRPRPSARDITCQLKREMQQAGIMSFEGFALRTVPMQTTRNSVSSEATCCWHGGSG